MRQVGWEADTENLRYSKGTRPAKGHNMAIAEWPTNSSVGQSGRVDYALFVDTKLIGVIEAKAIHKDIPSVIDYQEKNIRVIFVRKIQSIRLENGVNIKYHLLLLPTEDHI